MNVQALARFGWELTMAEAREHLQYSTATHVVVTREDYGQDSYPRCVAEEFTDGELTITAIDDQAVMHVYKAGKWQRATVYDARRLALYSLSAADTRNRKGVA